MNTKKVHLPTRLQGQHIGSVPCTLSERTGYTLALAHNLALDPSVHWSAKLDEFRARTRLRKRSRVSKEVATVATPFGRYSGIVPLLAAICALFLTGCVTGPPSTQRQMSLRLGQVSNKANVKVKVSLANRAVYLYEGNEPKWAAAVAIGTTSSPTPVGNFKAFNKLPRKRSNTYGFWVKGDEIRPGKRSGMPRGFRYVGYPMPKWVEFKSGYGFHAGAVWPQPRSHGCLRLHRTIAGEFFSLVNSGTPIQIARSLPEDATIGKKIPRPTDYSHPDSPPSVLITDAPFDSMNVYY